jgi:phosphoglycolate phosphatase
MPAAPLSILFDLDGTVVDSAPGILASSRAALAALGHPADDLDITGLIGPPLEEVLRQVLARFGDDRVSEAVLAYRDHYGGAGFRESTVYPGLAETLDALRGLGATLYIATSKRTVFAQRILEHLALVDRFAGVHGSEPGGAFDHKAELIAHVLARHGLQADRCLMVGDRRHDAEGARANGVATAGVLWGYGERDELLAAGAAHIAERPADLIPIAQGYGVGPDS